MNMFFYKMLSETYPPQVLFAYLVFEIFFGRNETSELKVFSQMHCPPLGGVNKANINFTKISSILTYCQ